MGQYTIQLKGGTKSAYIDYYNKNTNYGSSTILKLDNGTYIPYIYIPLSAIPLYKKIINAELYIYVTKGVPTPTDDMSISIIREEWNDSTITFDNRPEIGPYKASNIILDSGTGWKRLHNDQFTWIFDYCYNNQSVYFGFRINKFPDESLVEFYSMKGPSDKKPYIQVTYEDAIPQAPTEFGPTGKVNRGDVIRFTWQYNSEVGDYQTKFDLQWSSDNGQTWNTITRATSDTFYDMPAGTLPPGTIRVRVRTYDYYGQVSPWSDEIIYKNVAPLTPTDLSPDGLIIDGDLVNRFSWTYNSEIGDTQTKFDLQWSSDNGQTWNTITRTTSATYYDMPSRYLPNRNIVWRVRTYGYDEIAGPWSELATVNVYGSPPDPTIMTPSIVNSARPNIEWTTSDSQTAYEIQVLLVETIVWQTGEVTGTEQSVPVGVDLEKRNYTIRLRYKNNYDRWSNWTEKNITVQYVSPGTPQVSVYRNVAKAAIELIIHNIPGDDPFERNDIYRREYGESEWTIIASGIGENGSYVDYLVKSEVLYEYMVRTYTTSGGYAASAPVIADIKVNYTVLAPLQHPEQQITLKYDIERSEIQSRGRNFARFAGRKNPVAEYGEQQERGLNIRCTITNKEMLDQLMELLLGDEYLLYRDNKGRYMVCSVSGDIEMQEQRKWYKVSFSLIEVI